MSILRRWGHVGFSQSMEKQKEQARQRLRDSREGWENTQAWEALLAICKVKEGRTCLW